MKRKFIAVTTWFALILASGSVMAHEGHSTGNSFLSGMLHPMAGIDHLVVILSFGLMVGLWAGKRAGGLLAGFVALFALSAYAGSFSSGFAGLEIVIMNTAVAGVLLLLVRPLRGHQALMILFGLIAATSHGYVHGLELSSAAQSLSWLAGTAVSVSLMLALSARIARLFMAYQQERKLTAS